MTQTTPIRMRLRTSVGVPRKGRHLPPHAESLPGDDGQARGQQSEDKESQLAGPGRSCTGRGLSLSEFWVGTVRVLRSWASSLVPGSVTSWLCDLGHKVQPLVSSSVHWDLYCPDLIWGGQELKDALSACVWPTQRE